MAVLGTRGSPCLTIVGPFGANGLLDVLETLDDFVLSTFRGDDCGDSLAEVESGFEPLSVSFRETTLLNEGEEVVFVGDTDSEGFDAGALKSLLDILPHCGHLALNFAIASNLCPSGHVNPNLSGIT